MVDGGRTYDTAKLIDLMSTAYFDSILRTAESDPSCDATGTFCNQIAAAHHERTVVHLYSPKSIQPRN